MIVKVCGIRTQDNLDQLSDLPVDMVGYNFYPPSKRYIRESHRLISPHRLKKVGVFVNESTEVIMNKIHDYGLDYVQLHGNESVRDIGLSN